MPLIHYNGAIIFKSFFLGWYIHIVGYTFWNHVLERRVCLPLARITDVPRRHMYHINLVIICDGTKGVSKIHT